MGSIKKGAYVSQPAAWYGFKIPNLPRGVYEYVKVVRGSTGFSPWQVVILALKALEWVGQTHPEKALALVEGVKKDYPKP